MINVLGIATCFNRKEKTIKSINSLMNNDGINFSFVICDDNSKDGTKEELMKFDNVDIVEGNGNLYWCGGMRKAIEYALNNLENYDYCLLFNDDVRFFNNAITKLVSKDNNTVWIGPTCDNENNLTYGGIVKTSNFFPKYKTVKSNNEKGLPVDTFNANCVLIPWNIFKSIGNMDFFYSHSMGDYDYGLMIKKAKYMIKVSNLFVGECETNTIVGTWRDKKLPICERIKKKEEPKGLPYREWFYYINKNYNCFSAVIYSIKPYIDIIFRN